MTDEERAQLEKLAATLRAIEPFGDHAHVKTLWNHLRTEFHALTRKVGMRLEEEAKARGER